MSDYVVMLINDDKCQDAAIVENSLQGTVIATSHQSIFRDITPAEVKQLISADRGDLFKSGVTLAGKKCVVLRDNFFEEDETMDLKMLDDEQTDLCICVAKTNTMLVVAMGKRDVSVRAIHDKTVEVADYLRKNQM